MQRAARIHGSTARPALPRLGSVFRASLTDYYFNSMRLVPANVVWGVGVVVVVLVAVAWPLGGLLLLPVLTLPTAAVFGVAARIVRGEPDVGLHHIVGPYRRGAGAPAILAFGAGVAVVVLVLGTNLVTGLFQGEPASWVIATLAGWGLIALWCGVIVAWPLIVDPQRAHVALRARLRLAAALLLVDPARFGALALIVALISVVSVLLTVAILTVSLSFVALLACRAVYPLADRLDAAIAGERL